MKNNASSVLVLSLLAALLFSVLSFAGNPENEIANFSKEQIIKDYSFYHGDSLAGYDFLNGYKTATQVSHITLERELKSFFYIDETRFVKDQFHIADSPPREIKIEKSNSAITSTCNNLDFEDGNWNGWSGAYGYNTASCSNLVLTSSTINDGLLNHPVSYCTFHTLIGLGYPNDPYSNAPGVPPCGGNYAARLGGDWINLANYQCVNAPSATYSGGELLQQTFVVTLTNALFAFKYSVVMNPAPHLQGENPYFRVQVLDTLGNPLDACNQQCTGEATDPLSSYTTTPGSKYLPWTLRVLNLTPYIGQTVTIQFSAAGCIYGGHWGYAYIDGMCSYAPSITSACSGSGMATLTAPAIDSAAYHWTGPGIVGSDSTQSITVNSAGTYIVTVTPRYACSFTLSISFSGTVISATTGNMPILCYGSTTGSALVAVTSGTPPYTYSWSTTPVQTSATATNLGAGTYTVQVTDHNGCTGTATATITQPSPLNVSTINTNTTCLGSCNGNAIVSVSGGVGPYTYAWNTTPVQSSQTATNLCAGSYTITVIDNNGCMKFGTTAITQPSSLVFTDNVHAPTCISCTDGIINLYPAGGTPPYTTSISPAVGTLIGYSYINLPADTYYVCTVDHNGCQLCDSLVVPPYPTMVSSLNGSEGISFSPNPVKNGTTMLLNLVPENARLTLYDAVGRKVYETKIVSEKTFLSSSLFPSNGIYFAVIRNEDGISATAKLVVME